MKASELVLAPDGSLYHIRLTSSTLSDKVLLVGDPERVNMFKDIFESIEYESHNREIHALTGRYHGTRLTALSTGMGCDNIDIVMTELDAALRVDGGHWTADSDRHLQLVRIGTSGSLQADIDCGSHVASAYAIGLDGLMNYYKEWAVGSGQWAAMEEAFMEHMQLNERLARPLLRGWKPTAAQQDSHRHASRHHRHCPGLLRPPRARHTAPSGDRQPQRKTLRIPNSKLRTLVTNLEMETSAIYGFSHLLGHQALTVCLIIANRPRGTFLNDYHPQMRQLVGTVVERLAE